MNRRIISVTAVMLMALGTSATFASAQAPQVTAKPASASFTHSSGPTLEASRVGVSHAASASKAPVAYDAHVGAGRNIALMVVGVAALIIGASIGGGPGLLIAVGGAAVGLYGLYYFIQ